MDKQADSKAKQCNSNKRRLPPWLKRPIPSGEQFTHVMGVLKKLGLSTVCASASCPNRGECYSHGTATFMIMGDLCTRNCRFCAVGHGDPGSLSDNEPERLAQAVKELALKHVVITSVTRDDLEDDGANHFASTIRSVREKATSVTIEVLTPDFRGKAECIDIVCLAGPDVFNHNIETTRRLTEQIRSGADYERSLGVLGYVASKDDGPIVKSGFMLGLGEQEAEITEMLNDLKKANVEMVTIGQYLRPSDNHHPVERFYSPEEFEAIKLSAQEMGFTHVAAGPFVRSSYHAESSLKGHAGRGGL